MFVKHFGLREQPFGNTPDPKFLYFTAQHAEALAALHYGLSERRGLLVLTAEPGMGKTTLLHYLVGRWRDRAQVAFLFRPPESRDEMMTAVLADLGLACAGDLCEKRQMLQALALECHRQGRRLLLVFDEAQAIPASVLEEIRLLSNLETPQEKLIEIVLAGQPALSERLEYPESAQLGQRICVRTDVGRLKAEDVARYISHRLRVAGLKRRIFSRRALELAAWASDGVPRRINALCFEALSAAFLKGKKRIGEEEIYAAAAAAGARLAAPHPRRNLAAGLGWAAGFAGLALLAGTMGFESAPPAITRTLHLRGSRPGQISTAPAAPPAVRPEMAPAALPLAEVPGGPHEAAAEEQPAAESSPGDPVPETFPTVRVSVAPGETLRRIALREYGQWNDKIWQWIRRANPQLTNPDNLKAREVLLLPAYPGE